MKDESDKLFKDLSKCPIGRAINIAMKVILSVPETNGRMPYFCSPTDCPIVHSVPVKKSEKLISGALKNPYDSKTNMKIMPKVVANEINEQPSNNVTITACQRLLAEDDRSLYFGREAVSANELSVF